VSLTWLAVIFSFIGSVVGVLLTQGLSARSSRRLEESKRDWSERNRAYTDFLRSTALRAFAQTDDQVTEATRHLVDSKVRLAVYGGPAVITALAEFDRLGARLETRPQVAAFVSMCEAMRAEAPGVGLADRRDIARLLMGPAEALALPDQS
jgi:hypothetical protein